MWARATALLIAAAGCAPEPIRIDVPFDSADRSAVIAVEQGGNFEVFAVGDSERLSMPVLKRLESFDPKDGMTITVLLYRKTLAEHELHAGQLQRADNSPNTRSLPNDDRIVQGKLGASGEIAWTQLSAVPEPLASFKIEAEDRCSRLTGEVFTLGGERYLDGAVQLDEQTAWVVASEDTSTAANIYEVTKTGATRISTPTELMNLAVIATARDRSGKIWFTGVTLPDRYPQTYAGTPESGFGRVLGRPGEFRQDTIGWLRAGTPDEDPSTMYSLTQRGDLERYSEGEWTILHRENRAMLDAIGGIAVAATDEVYFVFPGGKALFQYDGLRAERVRTERDRELDLGADILRTVAVVPGFGEFAGTENGALMKREGDIWNVVATTPLIGHEIRAIVPFRDGLLLTGRYGFVYEYDPIAKLCMDQAANLSAELFLDEIIPLEDGWVVAGTILRAADRSEAAAGFVEIR